LCIRLDKTLTNWLIHTITETLAAAWQEMSSQGVNMRASEKVLKRLGGSQAPASARAGQNDRSMKVSSSVVQAV
jgi:hypothetical protein